MENPFVFYTNHQDLKYLVNKALHDGSICHWLLLFQEFEFEVIIQPGHTNVGLNQLSRILIGKELMGINDDFSNAHLFIVEVVLEELADIV